MSRPPKAERAAPLSEAELAVARRMLKQNYKLGQVVRRFERSLMAVREQLEELCENQRREQQDAWSKMVEASKLDTRGVTFPVRLRAPEPPKLHAYHEYGADPDVRHHGHPEAMAQGSAKLLVAIQRLLAERV